MSAATVVVGSAGRAHGSMTMGKRLPRELAAPATSDYSSFCLICASWYFGQHHTHCEKCGAPIFRWVLSSDLHHFRARTSLGAL